MTSAEPTPLSPLGLRIPIGEDGRGPALHVDPLFLEGGFEIQDEGSQLASLLASARAGEIVVDICAGGGGKSLALASLTRNSARLIATDAIRAVSLRSTSAFGAPGLRLRFVPRARGRRGPTCWPISTGRSTGADRCTLHRHRHVAAQS